MGIVGGKGCELQRRRERKNEFGLERQKKFLSALANSGNISSSAEKVGVSLSTIWMRRQDDQEFREAFKQAQDNAVILLRAELVRRGIELLQAATPDEQAAPVLAGMDAKFVLSLVVQHERAQGRELGDVKPLRSDASEAAARLQALLIRMRLERQKEMEDRRLERLEKLERKR
jgi:hypothetical protein